MTDWVKKHGAAVTAAAMAAGVLVANFGGLPPAAVDAIHGVVVAAGLVAGVAHAFLNGLGGNG